MTAGSFAIVAEHDAIRSSVRDFLTRHATDEGVRVAAESELGHDEAGWRLLGRELGLAAIGVPEELGGAGFGFAELLVALEELGGALYPSPLFATRVLAASALLEAGGAVAEEWLPRLAGGDTTATVAIPPGLSAVVSASVAARLVDDGYVLDGTCAFVVDGATADLVIVAAVTEGGDPALFLVGPDADGQQARPQQTVDLTRRQAELSWAGTPARLVASGEDAVRVVDRVRDLGVIALAAEQVGAAQRCLDRAAEHAAQRVQFGRVVGSFQAVKHLLADVLLDLDPVRAAVAYAGWAVDAAEAEAPALAALLHASAGPMAIRAAQACIQTHGGIGFTWEHQAHLYYRRARASAVMFGTPGQHREELLVREGVHR